MPTIKDNAVCIRLMDWSETSQIVVLMTERHGKVSATAKGAKRRQPSTLAKFSGGVELLTAGEAVLIVKPTADLANLIEWDLADAHWHLRSGLGAYRLAMYAADLVHHIVQDHDAHPATYAALRRFLADLAGDRHQAALLRFQWAVVTDMGSAPVLDRDARTGEPLPAGADTLAFHAEAGGLVADTGESDRWRLRRQTADLLRAAAAADAAGIDRAADPALRRANRLLCAYFRFLLDKQLPTMDPLLRD